ncbi:MAG: ATPase, T2SS/T4P/T4SS family [Patescibacteria group bacterium]|nr:MAG: ATPase, T2SS/T4P/T4SS family [Patescibacteria group bacterium]
MPQAQHAIVRVRRDGLLHDWFRLPKEAHEKFLGRLKRLARLQESAPLAFQDGPLRRMADGQDVEGWIEIVPVLEGEKAVIRLRAEPLGLDALGLESTDLERLRRCVRSSAGLLLVVGPRRAGLSTTLHALLEAAEPARRHVALVEKDFHGDLPGVDQHASDPSVGRSIASLLRASAASGAEVIGLGALHDEAAAALAVSIAEHRLVIAVLEAESMQEALRRLLELRIEARSAARVLKGVLVQRLARRVCSECRRRDAMTRAQADQSGWPRSLTRRVFDTRHPRTVVRGAKCEHCQFTGHRGQIGVFEWNDLVAPRRRRNTLLDSGVHKVLNGAIAPEEILRT